MIQIEFYKTCWNLICEPFINCVKESFEKEKLSNSQRQAVITLIEKKGKIVRKLKTHLSCQCRR